MRRPFSMIATAVLIAALASGTAWSQRAAGAGSTGNGGLSDRARFSDKNFKPTDARDPISRGLAAFDAGDYVLAERMFEEVLANSPDDPDVLILSGMSMAGRNDYKGARKQYVRALRADRKNIDGHRELGIALAKLGDAKGAQEQLADLKARQTACGAACADAGKLQRAVAAVEAALAPPKAG
jgi:tetratricopeptide (TPR) repeat protein